MVQRPPRSQGLKPCLFLQKKEKLGLVVGKILGRTLSVPGSRGEGERILRIWGTYYGEGAFILN